MNKQVLCILLTSAAVLHIALLGGCSSNLPVGGGDYAPTNPADISHIEDAVPRPEPRSRYGNPASYKVFGKRYHTLSSSAGYKERGIASWYGSKFHGRRTSSGEVYDIYKMTAAHKTLPLPTYARVTNLKNGRSIVVKVNDRGPFHQNRIIDLSYVAAAKLGIQQTGTGLVEVEAIDPSIPEPLPQQLATTDQTLTPDQPTLFLQVGAFGQEDNARRLRERLQESDFGNIRIVTGNTTNGSVYRVRIGPLDTVDEADRIANNLISMGISETHVIID